MNSKIIYKLKGYLYNVYNNIYIYVIKNNIFGINLNVINFKFNNKNIIFKKFYLNVNTNKNLFNNINHFINILEKLFISLLFILIYVYVMYTIYNLVYIKFFFIWYLFIILLLLLFSGFIFFLKRYKYSKFTSQIQRFWKRAYICFWLVETCWFLIFFYLLITTSDEPIFMQNIFNNFKTHLLSWRGFIRMTFVFTILMLLSNNFINFLNYSIYQKQLLFILIMFIIILFIGFWEFYQFAYIITHYNNYIWQYNVSNNALELQLEIPKLKPINHYLNICLLIKFWHFLFIFLSFLFFVSKVLEKKKISYVFFSMQNQNFIFLYIMNTLCMYSWVKLSFKRTFTKPYFWFFFESREYYLRIFFYQFIYYINGIFLNFNFLYKGNYLFYLYFYIYNSSYNVYYKNFFINFIN